MGPIVEMVVARAGNEVVLTALPKPNRDFAPWLNNESIPDVTMTIRHLANASLLGLEEGRRVSVYIHPQNGF